MTLYFEHLEEEKCNNGHGRYVVLTALTLLRIHIIWDVMPSQQMIGSRYFEGTLCCHCQRNYRLSVEEKAPCFLETLGTSHPVI
jgi:hypothetical protein